MTLMKSQTCWQTLGLAVWLALGATGSAQAQAPADPTRPPDAWLALQPQAATPGAMPDLNDSSGARITVTGKNRRYAVVDGQVVKAGDSVNGAKVVSIRADAVTVRQNDANKVLSLTPGVEKKTPKPPRRPAHKAPVNSLE